VINATKENKTEKGGDESQQMCVGGVRDFKFR
jgi:hypothetical protein